MKFIKWMALTAVLMLLAACGTQEETTDITEGAPAPAFTLPAASGGEVSLADYEGQPVLLYFHMAVG